MREGGDRLRFALEALEGTRIRGHLFGKDLDRDLAVQLRVAGPIDLSHAAGADRGDDLVGPEPHSRG